MKNFKLAVGLIMVVCVAALFSGCLGDKGDVTTPANTSPPATTTGVGSAGQSENSADQIAALAKKIDDLNNQIQSLQSSQQAGQQTSGYDDTQLKSQIADLQSQLNDAQTNLQAAKDAANAAKASADATLAGMQKKKITLVNYKTTAVRDKGDKPILGKFAALDCKMSCGAGRAVVGFNAEINDYPIIIGIQLVCADVNDPSDKIPLTPICGLLKNDNKTLDQSVNVPPESFATGFSFNVGGQMDNFTLISADPSNFTANPPNPKIGGSGGAHYDFSCGQNQVLTGITFNSREVVNGIWNYTCAEVKNDGSAAQTPAEFNSGNIFPNLWLDDGHWLGRVGGDKADGEVKAGCVEESVIGKLFINSGSQIDAMGFTCNNLHTGGITSDAGLTDDKTKAAKREKGGGTPASHQLDKDHLLVGWKTRTCTYHGDNDHTVICSFQPIVKKIDQNGNLTENGGVAPIYGTIDGKPDDLSGWVEKKCDGREVITEIVSHQGSRLDNLDGYCRPLKLFNQPQ